MRSTKWGGRACGAESAPRGWGSAGGARGRPGPRPPWRRGVGGGGGAGAAAVGERGSAALA